MATMLMLITAAPRRASVSPSVASASLHGADASDVLASAGTKSPAIHGETEGLGAVSPALDDAALPPVSDTLELDPDTISARSARPKQCPACDTRLLIHTNAMMHALATAMLSPGNFPDPNESNPHHIGGDGTLWVEYCRLHRLAALATEARAEQWPMVLDLGALAERVKGHIPVVRHYLQNCLLLSPFWSYLYGFTHRHALDDRKDRPVMSNSDSGAA
jgi:hypothetical protein